MTRATSSYLNRPLRTYAQALREVTHERAVRAMMWEQDNRARVIAMWQREAESKGENHGR